ncbi:MAG TPA: ferric reductase-like transmembrane domain-containing protein [Pseudonocardiaceae bacterium]
MSTEALWFLARGTGVTVLVLLTTTVGLGIATGAGRTLPGLPRSAVVLVHRNASLLAVTFLAVHVGTLLMDPYAQLRLLDLVLPFGGAYRPLWLGLGTAASDLLIAIIVTSLLRHRLGLRAWRAVHWLAYAAWPLALLHALGTGTDATTPWLRAIAAACVLAVGASLAWRFSDAAALRTPTTSQARP